MRMVLIYADAENAGVSEIDFWVNQIKEDCASDELAIGKFYGCFDQIKETMQICYEYGMEYVETSSLIGSRKNISDMKLVVDCITDALVLYQNKVSKVVILSKDCDFTPLIYKLRGSGIDAVSPLHSLVNRHLTVGDLNIALRDLQYNPVLEGHSALFNQYARIRELVDESFSDKLIDSFLLKRQKRFIKAIGLLCTPEQTEKLHQVPVREFSFKSVMAIVTDDVEKLCQIYVMKFFGFNYKDSEVASIIDEYVREA